MSHLRVARWLRRSSVNGPGERLVVWVQGCTLRCRGCWNPDTWSAAGGEVTSTASLLALYSATPGLEGITMSGGEPFQQADATAELCEAVQRAGGSVMVFTGYDLAELTSPSHLRLLDAVDILVAGRYDQTQPLPGHGWRGSANQQVHFLTGRHSPSDLPLAPEFEIHIEADGRLSLTGFPPSGLDPAALLEVPASAHDTDTRVPDIGR